MIALWLEDQNLTLREIPAPEPPPGEALIRVRWAGICGTDLEMTRGYYEFRGVLGHEFVGEVIQAHRRPGLVGKRVVGEINAVCRSCETCLRGDPTHCPGRTVLGIVSRNGAFAEYLTLPVENLHPVPDSVHDEEAVFAEPVAAALEILEQVRFAASDRVLLVGAGRLGQLIARVLASAGIDLTVSARYPLQRSKLEQAGLRWIEPSAAEGRTYDVVIEATGSPGGFAAAISAVRPRGTVVLKSTFSGQTQVNLSALVVDEIRLLGSRCGPMDQAINFIGERRIELSALIDERHDLRDGLAAVARAASPGGPKILLHC